MTRDGDAPVGQRPTTPRRPILARPAHRRRDDRRRPPVRPTLARPIRRPRRPWADRPRRSSGTTLDGEAFDLADLAGQPVVINFWGPSCVPCRDEFPLLQAKLAEHAADGLAIVGVLTDDPPAPARDFVAEYGATWPTVVDPDKAAEDRLPRRRPAADLLRRRRRDHPVDPDRRADATPTSSASTPRSRRDRGRRRRSRRSVVDGLRQALRRRGPSLDGVSLDGRAPASSSRCSGRTARARRRPSRSSRATGARTAGTVRVLGQDPATRRTGRSGHGSG